MLRSVPGGGRIKTKSYVNRPHSMLNFLTMFFKQRAGERAILRMKDLTLLTERNIQTWGQVTARIESQLWRATAKYSWPEADIVNLWHARMYDADFNVEYPQTAF